MENRFDTLWEYNNLSRSEVDRGIVLNFINNEITLAIEAHDREIAEKVSTVEPAPKLDEYLKIVNEGNKDDMYDYGVKLTRQMILALLTKQI